MMRFKKILTVFMVALFATVLFGSTAFAGSNSDPNSGGNNGVGYDDKATGTKLMGVVYVELYHGLKCSDDATGFFITEADEDGACAAGSSVEGSTDYTGSYEKFTRTVLRLRKGKEFHTLYGGGVHITDAGDANLIAGKLVQAMGTAILGAFGMVGDIQIKDLEEFGRVNTDSDGYSGNQIVLSDIVLVVQ